MRAEIFVTNTRMSEINGDKERYYSRLIDVEARLDRMETTSLTVAARNNSPTAGALESDSNTVKKEEEDGGISLSAQALKVCDMRFGE